jgi:hypothetical protein
VTRNRWLFENEIAVDGEIILVLAIDRRRGRRFCASAARKRENVSPLRDYLSSDACSVGRTSSHFHVLIKTVVPQRTSNLLGLGLSLLLVLIGGDFDCDPKAQTWSRGKRRNDLHLKCSPLLRRNCPLPTYDLRLATLLLLVVFNFLNVRRRPNMNLRLGFDLAAPGGHDKEAKRFADGNLPVLTNGATWSRPRGALGHEWLPVLVCPSDGEAGVLGGVKLETFWDEKTWDEKTGIARLASRDRQTGTAVRNSLIVTRFRSVKPGRCYGTSARTRAGKR